MPSNYRALKHVPKSKLRRSSFKFILALVLGLFKSITLYFLLHHQFQLSFRKTCILITIIGSIFTFVSCRSSSFQCVTLLMVPQVLSKQGRASVVAYAFILAINGPAKNTVANIEVLGRAMSCGQEQLKVMMHEALQAVRVPFQAMKKAIGQVLGEVEKAFGKVQEVLMQILRLVKNILQSIKAGYNWLANIVSVCNEKVGTPFHRCYQALEAAVDDCKRSLNLMGFLCDVTHVAKAVCYSVKLIDYFCELIDFVSDEVIDAIENELQELMHNIESMFRVGVDFDHAFMFKTNASKSFGQIKEEIAQEINSRSRTLLSLFNIAGMVSSFCFLCVILRSARYKMKYLTRDDFDNHYISEDFEAIDERRHSMGLDTILPLSKKETSRYIKLTSFALTRKEKLRIARSAVFLFMSSIQILGLIFGDYSLFWLLAIIHDAALREAGSEKPPLVTLEVNGSGIIADMYRGIVGAFEPMVADVNDLDLIQCIPNPHQPNFARYLQICLLLLSCWMCIILEPYGLRVRQLIMRGYFPERALERATWLYNDILLKRETFIKIARRQFSHRRRDHAPEIRRGWMEVLRAKTNRFWICRKILGRSRKRRCILCSSTLAEDEFISCLRPGCPGVYCYDCYLETQHFCSICSEPIGASDLSDDSVERDSSG